MRVLCPSILLVFWCVTAGAEEYEKPLVRVVDLNIGETREVTLHNDETCSIELLNVREFEIGCCIALRLAMGTENI